jgi:hypothetical protein
MVSLEAEPDMITANPSGSSGSSSMIPEVKTIIKGREIQDADIYVLAKQYAIHAQIVDVLDDGSRTYRQYRVSDEVKSFKLCRYRGHCFINELTELTKHYIENIRTLSYDKYNHRKDRNRSYVAKDTK